MELEDIIRELGTDMVHKASRVIINRNDNVLVFKNKYKEDDLNSCRLSPENTVTITIPLYEYEKRIEDRKLNAERLSRSDYAPF